MTMTEKGLREWAESMGILLSESQKTVILERFGTEPAPYEWSEQDIAEQIRKFVEHGYFRQPEPSRNTNTIPEQPGMEF